MLYYFKNGKNTTETHTYTHTKICAVTDQTCQKWFAKFRAGDFLLDDAPQLGRPVEADSNQIKTLIENNQCFPMWERVDILKISKSIKLLVKIKKCDFHFTLKTQLTFWPTQ